MTTPSPFVYPGKPHKRRHAPAGYIDYRDYKPWLRDEYAFRCVYCLERERWYPSRAGSFSVDHLAPQSSDPDRICDYENLVYACLRCNSAKRDVRLADPGKVSFGSCLRVDGEGRITSSTPEGRDMIDLLHLDDFPAVNTRKRYLRILRLKMDHPQNSEVHRLYLDAFGYPEDLPDLASKQPPKGNRRRKSGLVGCCFSMRQEGKLNEVY